MDGSGTTEQVLFDTAGPIGLITLNRPQALNALTLDMIRAIEPRLVEWAEDPEIRAVVVRGAGDRAYCAGGDLMAIYDAGPERAPLMADDPDSDFFRREYVLNWRIHHYPKPYVALIDGVTMGGGVGLSVHGSHRIATERTVFAMPECGIGLFPDVGGSWFLPRCPGALGMFLALTGHRMKAADSLLAGIATHHVPADRLDALVDGLAAAKWSGPPQAVVDQVMAGHAADPGAPPLAEALAAIDRCFAAETVEGIRERLAEEEGDWAAAAGAALDRNSPTSMKVTLQQLRRGGSMDYDSCVTMEYRMVQRFIAGHDLFEGIRAAIVDKDRNPAWRPATLDAVPDEAMDRYFEPLGARDLILP